MSAARGREKGCFQCSKRRIACDKTEPTCKKCIKKGIDCSGLGRIRFSNGVAQRGHLRGCTIPVSDQSIDPIATQTQPSVPREIRWKNDRTPYPRRKRRKPSTDIDTYDTAAQRDFSAPRATYALHEAVADEPDIEKNGQGNDLSTFRTSNLSPNNLPTAALSLSESIRPWISPLNPQARMLMAHFAEHVAPVMVVLDISNGYRDILLPLACEDPLIQRAVGVVAAQHLALHQPSFQVIAEQGRASLISRLSRDSFLESPHQVFNLSTWATLIILLVGETITGSSEYSHLLKTLMCLVQNVGQIPSLSAQNFLAKQTHMFEFLGQPLLGEQTGVEALTLPPENYLDWTYYDLRPDSEYNHLLDISRMAFIKASQIYLGRVGSDLDQWEHLESLKDLVMQIDPEQLGSHALVWVCFIAAADSTDPEHRNFFVGRMNKIFEQTKFQNIVAGMQSLPAIWAQRGSGGRWTSNLRQLAPTLIM